MAKELLLSDGDCPWCGFPYIDLPDHIKSRHPSATRKALELKDAQARVLQALAEDGAYLQVYTDTHQIRLERDEDTKPGTYVNASTGNALLRCGLIQMALRNGGNSQWIINNRGRAAISIRRQEHSQ